MYKAWSQIGTLSYHNRQKDQQDKKKTRQDKTRQRDKQLISHVREDR